MSEIQATLRGAEVADLPALAQLHIRAFNQTHGAGPDASLRERQWREKFGSPRKLLFCVVLEARNGELIGFASGETHVGPELAEYRGLLDKIYLLREYHRQSLERLLSDVKVLSWRLQLTAKALCGHHMDIQRIS